MIKEKRESEALLDITLLGCGGSLPVPNRNLTSLLIGMNGSKILVDCGEGTQVSMKRIRCGFKNIDAILITHFHADHVLGLPGLLLTIANSDRKEPLTIIGPKGASETIKSLMVICPNLSYKLNIIECDDSLDNILDIGGMKISTLKLEHSVPCLGYSFNITRGRKFEVEMARKNNVPLKFWNALQKGDSITSENITYTPDMVLGESREGLKVSYITDTRPIKSIIKFIDNSDLFICEGMYGCESDKHKAITNKHMTFKESAILAKEGNVKSMWLTHFSPSLDDPDKYLDNAKEHFENVIIGKCRMNHALSYKEE